MNSAVVTGVGSFSPLLGVRKNCTFGRQDTSI